MDVSVKMDDSKRITRNLSFIKKNINDIDDVIDILIEEEILGMGERHIILSDNDPIHSVLEIILKKQAYNKFTGALKQTGNDQIATRLQMTDIPLEKEMSNITNDSQDSKCQYDLYTDEDYKKQKQYVLQKDLELLTKENDNLKQQQALIRKDLNIKQQKLLELNREALTYQKQNLELNQRLTNVSKSDIINEIIDTREGELKKKDERNEEIKKELAQKNDEISHLRELLEELRKELDEKSDQIAMLSRELKHLRDEHVSARRERKELKLKVENINNNFDEKMKAMMTALSEKTFRTSRQSTFIRTISHSRNGSRENTSLPNLNVKASGTPRGNDTRGKHLPKENSLSPRPKLSRQQQFISPNFVFTAKITDELSADTKPKPQWK